MKNKIFHNIEVYLFLIFSIISLLPFFLCKYVPSLDGPQHLYSARLITELLKGNDFISQFFRFNPLIVGNQTSLFIMAVFMFVFPAWLAEKIFLSIYVIGLALSFRYFTRSINKNNSLLYLLIFPFAFSSLFMLGYYNFCLAFIPFFLALGYFKRHENNLGLRETIWLIFIITLIYLTHAIVFVFFGLVMILQMLFDIVYPLILKNFTLKGLILNVKKYLIILIGAIPGIILWGFYYLALNSNKQSKSDISFIPTDDILEGFYKLRILIGFHHEIESSPNTYLFWFLVALIILAFIPFKRIFPRLETVLQNKNSEWIKWTLITVVFFFLAIFLPDRLVTGSMSARLSILFFLLLITWISIQSYPKMVQMISLVLILGTLAWHRQIVLKFYQKINLEIADLETTGEFIKPNTVIFPINCSENWLQLHFHCYLGVDKPMVNLRNPQANGPMPLIWNHKKMPNILLGELDQKQAGVHWSYGNSILTPIPSDYIFIWRSQRIEAVEGTSILLDKVKPYYTETYRSKGGNSLLYTVK